LFANTQDSVDALFKEFPLWQQTPELKVHCREDNKFQIVTKLIEHFKDHPLRGELITMDGLRMNYEDGWFLVRASNTTPCLTVRFEASSAARLDQLQQLVRVELLRVDPLLAIPF
jgi:phosphomannomutase